MEATDHAFFTNTVKDLEVWYKITQRVMGQIENLRGKIVEYENRANGAVAEYSKRVTKLEEMDKQIREKRLLMDSRTSSLRDDLERRRNEVAEREAKLNVREAHINEMQKEVDSMLSAAENQEKKRGRPALSAK